MARIMGVALALLFTFTPLLQAQAPAPPVEARSEADLILPDLGSVDFLGIPGLHWLFARGYRWFANNRYPISRACGLRPPTEAEQRLRASVPPPPLPAAVARPSRSSS